MIYDWSCWHQEIKFLKGEFRSLWHWKSSRCFMIKLNIVEILHECLTKQLGVASDMKSLTEQRRRSDGMSIPSQSLLKYIRRFSQWMHCLMFTKWKMFYVWLVEQSSSLEPGYSEFRLLFAVDSVRSVDFKCLKDILKSLFGAHWDTASNMLVLYCWRLILIGASPRYVLFPGGNSRGSVGIGSHFADSL